MGCSGNPYQKCGSEEQMYYSVYYVGPYFGLLDDQEGGNKTKKFCSKRD